MRSLPDSSRCRSSMTAGTLRSTCRKAISRCSARNDRHVSCCGEAAGSQQIGWDAARGRVGRAPYIAFDFPDELLDALGGPHGLLALHADDGAPGLLVRQIELDEAARDEHTAHQRDEHDDVLPRQPSLRMSAGHCRMLSARRRTLRGMASPSSPTVFRLMVRSILSAACTGRSSGGVPRRTFATSCAAWTPCA